MRIPTLAVTTVAAAALVALPTAANAAAPDAVADSAATIKNTAKRIMVLANDTKDPGRTLTVTSAAPAASNGTVACDSISCTYTPNAGWIGTDSFTYTISDGAVPTPGTDSAVVTVETGNEVGSVVTTLSNTTLRWPEITDITGTVKDPSGVAMQGVSATLWAKPFDGEWTQVSPAARTTNASGKVFESDVRPETRTQYQWRTALKTSASRSVAVTPALAATATDKTVKVGETVTISGIASPVAEGAPVELQKKTTTGSWETVQAKAFAAASNSSALDAKGKLASGAPFTFDVTTVNGSSAYRISLPADAGRNGAIGSQVTLKGYKGEITKVIPTNSDEVVVVENTGKTALNLQGWKLTDDSDPVVSATLPVAIVPVGGSLRIHSGRGTSTSKNLYLRKVVTPDSFWDSSGVITLTDDHAKTIHAFTYSGVTPAS